MAKHEQGRGENPSKQEASPTQPEKGVSTIDTAYFSLTQRYFNGRKNKMKEVHPNMDESNLMYEQFLVEQQEALSKIARFEKLEKTQPTEISFALAELSGTMANTNPESAWVNHIDKNLTPELIQERENLYLESKKLYMETCKKMFPETEAGLIPSQLHLTIRKIKKVDLFDFDGKNENPHVHNEEFLISDIQRLLKENPRELLKRIDEVLYWAGDMIKGNAYRRFTAVQNNEQGGEIEAVEKEEKRLGILVEPMYKLELIKDQVLKKVYGREDTTPSERKEIDQAREEI